MSSGLGINSPFGLKTHYNVPWVGQLLGIESDLKTMAINPVVSFKGDDTFSIAVGFIAQKADATLTSATGLGVNPTQAQIKGDDWGYGFNLGALWHYGVAKCFHSVSVQPLGNPIAHSTKAGASVPPIDCARVQRLGVRADGLSNGPSSPLMPF